MICVSLTVDADLFLKAFNNKTKTCSHPNFYDHSNNFWALHLKIKNIFFLTAQQGVLQSVERVEVRAHLELNLRDETRDKNPLYAQANVALDDH